MDLFQYVCVPRDICVKNIEKFHWSYNFFQLLAACAGSIPKELGALTKLDRLQLDNNQLTGKRRALRLI